MTWRELNNTTAAFAVITAMGVGVAIGATVLDGDPPRRDASATRAEREPLRKAPLLRAAREPREAAVQAGDPEAEEARPAQLSFPEPSEFRVGAPEHALAAFMQAWRDRRWSVMRTWTAAQAGPDARRSSLEQRYGAFRLRGWRIVNREPARPPGSLDFQVEIAYRSLLDPVLRRVGLDFRVARRTADGEASARTGSWGVDPVPRLTAATASG